MNIQNSDLRRDLCGRYLLDDIYKAAIHNGFTNAMTPRRFMDIPAVKSYEAKVSKENRRPAIQEGLNGNYAEEILALKYANHIDHRLEIALSVIFKENNYVEPSAMEAEITPVKSEGLSSTTASRTWTILEAIKAANEILSQTPGIDLRSSAECSLRLMEVNLGMDMTPALDLLRPKRNKVAEAKQVQPTLPENQQALPGLAKPTQRRTLSKRGLPPILKTREGHPYTMTAADLAAAVESTAVEVNAILDGLGLQEKMVNGQRRATEKTGDIARMVDIGENGKPNPRLLWHPEMVTVLKDNLSKNPIQEG